MPVTDDQYARILARLTRIEEVLNDVLVAIGKFVTRSDVSQLTTLLQTELVDLRETVDALEARVETIEEEPIS
jgi:polyhydroxyalkanoate synthesis regulator phasin